MKRSSAQLTVHYKPDQLIGRQVCAVVNFPPRQIGPFMSEVLTLGHAGRGRRGGADQARLQGAERRQAVLMAAHYYTVTWDQLHRDARALAWRLMDTGPVRRHRRDHPRRADPGGDRRARAGVPAGRERVDRDYAAVSGSLTRRSSGGAPVGDQAAGGGRRRHGFLIVDDLVDTGATARVVRGLLPRAHFAASMPSRRGGRRWTASSPRCRRTPGSCSPGTPSRSSSRRWSKRNG